MPHLIGLEFLRGDTAVDIEAMRREVTVDFANEAEQSDYEKSDWRLHCLVEQSVVDELGGESAASLVAVHADWSPNKTKTLSCEFSAISAKLLGRLQALLKDDFAGWSIAIEVHHQSKGSETDVGPVRIYCDKVFAVQALAAKVAGGA